MNKTFKSTSVNGHEYQLLALPNTNLFQFEIVNLYGSNIERVLEKHLGENLYGISHFIEHLGFRCTKDYTTDELMGMIKNEGAYNASTDHDRINYWFRTTMNRADTAIRLVCNYALNDLKNINQEEFDIEKKVVYNEAKRYADDDQTMFYFNTAGALCGYHIEDNVIGIADTIDTFTLKDAILVKDIFLNHGESVYNITYDPMLISADEVIAKVEAELARFPASGNKHDIASDYSAMLGSPGTGTIKLQNESEQHMTSLCFDVITDLWAARLGNAYLARYAETSLTDIIREKHGLTYGIHFGDEQIGYEPYTMFACDVSKGTEDQLMQLFKQSICESVDNFNVEAHKKLMDTRELQRTLAYIDQQKYMSLHWTLLWHHDRVPYEFIKDLSLDIDQAIINMDANEGTFEKVQAYLDHIKSSVLLEEYSIVTN